MGRINQELLQRIADTQGISVKSVYRQISMVVHDTFLERDLAALVLASNLHINIRKYSTAEQRELIRQYLNSGAGASRSKPTPEAAAPAPIAPATRSRANVARAARKRDNSVFVISGRDTELTESMFSFLSAIGCKPVEFHQAVTRVRDTGNPFIGVVLDKVFEQMQALVVLFSPDDEVKLKDQFLKRHEVMTEGRYQGQARPNVSFEAGMAIGRHQGKTIMVQVGEMKSFSDIAGRHMVHLDDSFESRNAFANRLGKLCRVDTSGNLWAKVGTFKPTAQAASPPTPTKPSRRSRAHGAGSA